MDTQKILTWAKGFFEEPNGTVSSKRLINILASFVTLSVVLAASGVFLGIVYTERNSTQAVSLLGQLSDLIKWLSGFAVGGGTMGYTMGLKQEAPKNDSTQ